MVKPDYPELTMIRKALFLAVASSAAFAAASAMAQSESDSNWGGPYIGLNAGWRWGRTDIHSSTTTVNQLSGVNAGAGPVTVPPASFPSAGGRMKGSGFMGGGQLGFNVQSGGIVWGLEGDFDGVSGGESQTRVYSLAATDLTTGGVVIVRRQADPQWLATIRGRVGLETTGALFYGTGGAAFADLRNHDRFTYAPTVTNAVIAANPGVTYGPYFSSGGSSGVRTGWTAGGGVELMGSRGMTFGLEYRHTEIGSNRHTYGSTAPNGVSERARFDFTDDAVLAKVNFKFSGVGGMF
jgi:outer membrane immunogenic protein